MTASVLSSTSRRSHDPALGGQRPVCESPKVTDTTAGDLWAAQTNAEECGNLLFEANEHLREMAELLEDDKARRLLGLYLGIKAHLKHEQDCKPCAETRLKYSKMRASRP